MEKSPGKPRVTAKDIAGDIRRELVTGAIGPGDRLTAARELAKDYGVTLVTVQSAYRELRDEGLVVSQQGRGTFVVDPTQQAPDDENRGGSAFMTLAAEINAMHETIRSLGDRLERLEQAVEDADVPPAR